MLSATNNTIRYHRTAKRKKWKLYYIAIHTCKLYIYYSNEYIVPKGQP